MEEAVYWRTICWYLDRNTKIKNKKRFCTVNCKVPELTRLVNPAIVSVAEINTKNYHPGKFTFSCHCVRRWCSVIWACSGRSDVLLREPIFHHEAFFYKDVNFKRLLLAPALLQRKQSNSWFDRFCFSPC